MHDYPNNHSKTEPSINAIIEGYDVKVVGLLRDFELGRPPRFSLHHRRADERRSAILVREPCHTIKYWPTG